MPHFDTLKRFSISCAIMVILSVLSLQTFSQVFTVDSIMRNGRRSNRINCAYMSDGYLAAQLPLFITNATTINNALFATSPFSEYQNYFNSFAIQVPSTQAGAKHPGTASDEPAGVPVANPSNYFQSTFDYFNIHRLLVPQNNAGINGVLASNLPDYDQSFVVVNSPYYGGSGGTHATASTDPSSAEVAIHEIGHSFADLADEYWAGTFYAAEKANMTANNNPATVKWKNWLGINGIGIYPHGATAPLNSWFKPHQSCKMQVLFQPFCSVCSERLIDRVHQLVNMIDAFAPASTSFTLPNMDPVVLSVNSITTTPNTVIANWYLNNTLYAPDQPSISIPYNDFVIGANTVRVEVIDNTSLSKSYLPGVGYVNSLTWNITKNDPLPIVLKSFTGRIVNKAGQLNWDLDNGQDVKRFELSKSKNGTDFSLVTTIDNDRNKDKYSYTDPLLLSPYTYYRLKLIDKDGTEKYSPVIRLQNAFGNYVYKVYQNPELHRYHLTAFLSDNERVAFQLTDASGKLLQRKDFGKVSGQLDHNIDLAGKAAGIYFFKININNSNYTVQLLAK